MQNKLESIIWDWNGTLLDDVSICLEGINRLLTRRGLICIDRERYQQIFTFPVKDYYLAAGFDFASEPFEIAAEEYITEYQSLLPGAGLFEDAKTALEHFRQLGFRQFIVSAMEQNALLDSVDALGISSYFERIYGIRDNLAFSKANRGMELIADCKLDASRTLMIGDTLHDHEVGQQMGVKVVLVSRGHQCHTRLGVNGNVILGDFGQLIAHLEKQN